MSKYEKYEKVKNIGQEKRKILVKQWLFNSYFTQHAFGGSFWQ